MIKVDDDQMIYITELLNRKLKEMIIVNLIVSKHVLNLKFTQLMYKAQKYV